MDKNNLKDTIPGGFSEPTSLPRSEEEAAFWQKANLAWWEDKPMRYDWKKKVGHKEFSKDFYTEIDKRFFESAKEYLRDQGTLPFSELINSNSLKNKDVLEIGVGNGSHAQLLASYAKSFTGIDITRYAVKSTSERMRLFGLRGNIRQMDAEKMVFKDNSFDFVWSWGVIHHSANPQKILEEIHRVLRPEGVAIIMVYHRGWWNYYFMGFLWGILSGEILKTKSLHRTMQFSSDGAIARYYTADEWKLLTKNLFKIEELAVFGPKTDILPLPAGKIKDFVRSIIPSGFNRFLTHRLKMGSFLVSRLRKEECSK